MNFLRIVIIALGFALVACSSPETKPPKTQEFFNTLIKRDGAKQFSYTMTMEIPAGGKRMAAGKRGGPRGGHGGPPGGPPHEHGDRPKGDKQPGEDQALDDRFIVIFNKSLLAKLSDTGFCQQGYKQLDKKSRKGVTQVTGECNDRASDKDKAQFPNPAPVKVKEERIE